MKIIIEGVGPQDHGPAALERTAVAVFPPFTKSLLKRVGGKLWNPALLCKPAQPLEDIPYSRSRRYTIHQLRRLARHPCPPMDETDGICLHRPQAPLVIVRQ